jgi:hypothetical protein
MRYGILHGVPANRRALAEWEKVDPHVDRALRLG